MSVKDDDGTGKILLANITWNPSRWRCPLTDSRAGSRYAKEYPGHESVNFKFDKRIDKNGFIHGFVHRIGTSKTFHEGGIVFFFTRNLDEGRGEIVGVYGNAHLESKGYECKGFEDDTAAANICAEEKYSMLFPIPLVAKKYKESGKRQLMGTGMFCYKSYAFAKKVILDELNMLNKNGILEKEFIKLKGIYKYLNKLYSINDDTELVFRPGKELTVEPSGTRKGHGGQGGSGESEEHKQFKEFIAKHPELLKIKGFGKGKLEYTFPSQDTIDVYFSNANAVVGVEVKSKISNEDDIVRGLYQCKKYEALIEAENRVKNKKKDKPEVILALECEFPKKLLPIKKALSVNVIDNIR